MSIFKVGIVGAGYAGKVHLNVLKKIKDVKIQSLCDVNQNIVSRVAEEYGIKNYYTDFEKMLDNADLDIVNICTPPIYHAPLAIMAIESGINVLIEKPLTENTQEATKILNALKKTRNGVKVGVVHNYIFHHITQKILKMLERDEIGNIINISIEEIVPFNFDPFISNKDHWCHKLPGGRVTESLPHPIYLAQEFLAKPKITNISAKKLTKAPWVSFDEVQIMLESDSASGNIYWSRNTQKSEYLINLIGKKGIIRANLYSGSLVKILGLPKQTDLSQIRYTLGEGRQFFSSLISNYSRRFIRRLGLRRAYLFPHEACFYSFIESIKKDKEPYITVQKGYDCIELVDDISRDFQEKLTKN